MTIKISLQQLVESGAHFGHQTKRWNPKMKPYLYGDEEGVHIFDLIKTKGALSEAMDYLENAAKEGKKILMVGTKKQAAEKVRAVAQATGVYYVDERWLGGTLTNFGQIKKSLRKLEEMKEDRKAGKFKKLTKKERLLIDREIERLERFFGGIADMTETPEVLVVVDIKRETGAVREAKMKGVTTIGIVDSNSDPERVDYPIPMNDDATAAVSYVLDLIGQAIAEGQNKSKSSTKSRGSNTGNLSKTGKTGRNKELGINN